MQKLQHLHGFDALDCYTENAEDLNDSSNRANKRDVLLVERVREAAIHLNQDIPATAIEDALDKLLDRRQALTLIAANREIYGLLRDGIPVEFDNAQGVRQHELVQLLDFNMPDSNRYLVVTQLWICAMWLTGFDAPTLSTLYLDKPMQGHTLMQTIARANRVTSWKINGWRNATARSWITITCSAT